MLAPREACDREYPPNGVGRTMCRFERTRSQYAASVYFVGVEHPAITRNGQGTHLAMVNDN